MIRWLGILLRTLRSAVRTRRELALENLAPRQQLAVWKSASAAATADGDGQDLLGRAVATLEELAEVLCRWCGPRPWCGGTAGASGSTGHGRVDADGVGPRLGGNCGIGFGR